MEKSRVIKSPDLDRRFSACTCDTKIPDGCQSPSTAIEVARGRRVRELEVTATASLTGAAPS